MVGHDYNGSRLFVTEILEEPYLVYNARVVIVVAVEFQKVNTRPTAPQGSDKVGCSHCLHFMSVTY